MQNIEILKTENETWGFWGTSVSSGYDAALAWNTVSRFLATGFDLTPEQTRDILDSRFGRHLADDLSGIDNGAGFACGPISAEGITRYLTGRAAYRSWRDCFENAYCEVTGKTFPRRTPMDKDTLFTDIAQKHLGIETLALRNRDSLDFHDVSVSSVKAALDAAFEAGKAAANGKIIK
mgnify:CR=1 FL=1